MVYDRWIVESNWAMARDVILGGIPGPMRSIIAPVARRGIRKQLEAHGIGRHSRDEIAAIGRSDVGAIAEVLGDKPFLMGNTPTRIDASAYGLLANIATVPIESPVREAIDGRPNLVRYIDRVRERYYARE